MIRPPVLTSPKESLHVATPLGEMRIVAYQDQLCGMEFVDQRWHPQKPYKQPRSVAIATAHQGSYDEGDLNNRKTSHLSHDPDSALKLLQQATDWLENYFAGHQVNFEVNLATARGTDLQRSVWQYLLSIPWGKTQTYLQVATALGNPKAVRAVANAIGKNPLAILVPCHRVIGSNGTLTGYAGGLERKQWLLEHEGALKSRQLTLDLFSN